MGERMKLFASLLLVSAFALTPMSARASDATSFGDEARVGPREGGAIYRAVCQGCHMPQGEGAVGAGAYPALAKNDKLEAAGYAVFIVINGQKAMPPIGSYLDDEQVAAVVTYIRTHFGNAYKEPVSLDDVKASRP